MNVNFHSCWSDATPESAVKPTLVMMHGFAGSVHSFDLMLTLLERDFHCLRIDLPGHGKTPAPNGTMSLADLADELAAFIISKTSGSVLLFGYSMGARVALHLALQSPPLIRALVLLGASPGIADVRERENRMNSDLALAENIRARGIQWFADYWGQLPLFASQQNLPQTMCDSLRESRLACDPHGLAFALENFGTGTQTYLLPKLSALTCPVLLLAGELDEKFCALNRQMETAISSPIAQRVEIPHAGHAAHLENPTAVAECLRSFFQTTGHKL